MRTVQPLGITSPRPLALAPPEAPAAVWPAGPDLASPGAITVPAFLRGKTVLLTGGTGFLGKVLVERLLRCAPDLARIYLLIRPRYDAARQVVTAAARFDDEVLASPAFSTLARLWGNAWPAFARARLVPVSGDVATPRLGLAEADFEQLAGEVDIVINAAASVAFDEPLDEALRQNVRSVQHVAWFTRACRAASLVHVSTAFVAGRRTGRFLEGPLLPNLAATEVEALDARTAALLTQAIGEGWDDRQRRARLVDEGMTRARALGWHDAYTFTKALGEMELANRRGDVPTAVLRPSIIESSLHDPAPGWLENLNVGDPLWVEFGRGRMPDFPLSPTAVLDMVPVDFVANAIVALLPRVADTREIAYYTVGSGGVNPLTGRHIHELSYDYFLRHPMYDRRGQPITPHRLTFPSYREFRAAFGGDARGATTKRLMYLADLYETYMNTPCVFDTANTQRLLDGLPASDRAMLDFDVRRIDWRAYIQDVHIPGLRRHVLGERSAPAPAARNAD